MAGDDSRLSPDQVVEGEAGVSSMFEAALVVGGTTVGGKETIKLEGFRSRWSIPRSWRNRVPWRI